MRQHAACRWPGSASRLVSSFLTACRALGLRITTTIAGVLLLLIASVAQAQSSGRVIGRVLDQTGAVLPGVAIDLVVEDVELTTTTDGEGRYQLRRQCPQAARS